MTEKEIEEMLSDIILGNAEGTEFEDCDIDTFAEASILTRDKGIIVYLPDGSRIYLTIQGYMPNGQRMD